MQKIINDFHKLFKNYKMTINPFTPRQKYACPRHLFLKNYTAKRFKDIAYYLSRKKL